MDRKLLKEAIADAKAVKETAIANAKAALEEAFTPQLKSMFAAKIQEMEDEDNMEEAYDMDNMDKAYDMDNMDDEMEEEMDYSEDLDEVELDEEEFNLDELLAELEGLEEEESTEDNLNEAEGDEEESEEEEMSDEDMEAETLDLENMTDEDLKKFIEDVITDMVQAGELEAGEGMEEEEEMENEEVDIDELLAEASHDKNMKEASHDKNMKEKAKKGMKEEKDEMKEELEEAYATIQKLTQDINEINLLNAKLLYTNKIFKASALTESQKVKVLSSMDKATNVKEVKLVYESLSENLKPKKAPIKENLNFASKSAGVAPRVAQSNPILDPAMVARFKKIAGI